MAPNNKWPLLVNCKGHVRKRTTPTLNCRRRVCRASEMPQKPSIRIACLRSDIWTKSGTSRIRSGSKNHSTKLLTSFSTTPATTARLSMLLHQKRLVALLNKECPTHSNCLYLLLLEYTPHSLRSDLQLDRLHRRSGVQLTTVMSYVRNVPRSSLDWSTDYYNWGSEWIYSFLACRRWDSASDQDITAYFRILYDSVLMFTRNFDAI
jgi:hypothetical protein